MRNAAQLMVTFFMILNALFMVDYTRFRSQSNRDRTEPTGSGLIQGRLPLLLSLVAAVVWTQ